MQRSKSSDYGNELADGIFRTLRLRKETFIFHGRGRGHKVGRFSTHAFCRAGERFLEKNVLRRLRFDEPLEFNEGDLVLDLTFKEQSNSQLGPGASMCFIPFAILTFSQK